MQHCLIVEDIPECREWLGGIVSKAFPGAEIEEAGGMTAALAALERGAFDLALIDIGLPDGSGLEVIRRFRRSSPETLCVIITVVGEDSQIVSALSAGACGYLLKEHPAELLSRQLADLSHGLPPLSPSVALRIMEHFQRTGPMGTGDGLLTKREKQALALISRGLRNGEVAEQLGISQNTVASHVKSIYQKLGISSRAEASWYATQMGL